MEGREFSLTAGVAHVPLPGGAGMCASCVQRGIVAGRLADVRPIVPVANAAVVGDDTRAASTGRIYRRQGAGNVALTPQLARPAG